MTKKESIKSLPDIVEITVQTSIRMTTSNNFGEIDSNRQKLLLLISNRINALAHKHNCMSKRAYEYIDVHCQIAPATMKKILEKKYTITREFLYKFTVGLGMSINDAQEYFRLQGGELRVGIEKTETIVYNALRDKDDIDNLIGEFSSLLNRKL